VVCLKDYELGKETDLISGSSKKLDLPKSDVLQFITADGCIVSARPSGTEPKIKFYCSVKTALPDIKEFGIKDKQLDEKIEQIMHDLAV
jgi:phosphoglucomutase